VPKRLIPNEIESTVALRHETAYRPKLAIQAPHLGTPGEGAFKQ
jgi:hypothetical protein